MLSVLGKSKARTLAVYHARPLWSTYLSNDQATQAMANEDDGAMRTVLRSQSVAWLYVPRPNLLIGSQRQTQVTEYRVTDLSCIGKSFEQ